MCTHEKHVHLMHFFSFFWDDTGGGALRDEVQWVIGYCLLLCERCLAVQLEQIQNRIEKCRFCFLYVCVREFYLSSFSSVKVIEQQEA